MVNLPIHKDLRKLCRDAKKQGFTVHMRGNHHFIIAHPSGPSFTISSTPSQGAIRDARQNYTKALKEIR
jgi:hypothetical protein